MEREKILVNFRTFKTYKTALDFISKKRGLSVTQFLNRILYNSIVEDVTQTAAQDATQQIALKHELPNRWAIRYDRISELARTMEKEKYRQFIEDWSDQFHRNVVAYCSEIGFEDSDVEISKIIEELTE
jgi:hypothetical protein